MPETPYPYATGKDPQFDAFKAKHAFSAYDAQLTADRRRRQAQEDYDAAIRSLDQQGKVGKTNLDTNMLSRGVFKSGETNRRHAELDASLLQGRAAADTGLANMLGQVSQDLQRAMIGNGLEWEQAVAAALARAGSGGGAGGGGGGSKPAATTTITRPKPRAAIPAPYVGSPVTKVPTYATRYS
jgi:hypothetical protein